MGSENIIIYYIRSGIAVLLDPAGNVCEVKTVVNSAQSNRHLSNYLQSPKKTVNGVEYYLKDKPGFLEWSKASYSIMGYISNGEDTVLHDASDFYYLKRIIDITVFTGLFAYAIIAAYRYHKKH